MLHEEVVLESANYELDLRLFFFLRRSGACIEKTCSNKGRHRSRRHEISTLLQSNTLIMKIIHTSDWHIGHVLYGIDRSDDHHEMLACLTKIIKTEQPDLLLVSGDIYHTSQPSASAQRMLTEALLGMKKAAPGMLIVLTSGNHDSASRHESHAALWESAGIHTIGSINVDSPADNILELPGKGWVAAVPYVNDRQLPDGYYQSILDEIGKRNTQGLPIAVSAHTTVRGADCRGHDDTTDYCVGGIDYKGLSEMGEGYDYLALGHIHTPQTIRGSHGHARYCGTPLPISFDETFDHSVSIVEISSHGKLPEIREEEIKTSRPLVNIPAEGTSDWESILEMLKSLPADKSGYLRLNVEVENVLEAGAFTIASELLEGKQYRLATINASRRHKEAAESSALTMKEFEKITPLEMAKRYCRDSSFSLTDRMEELFREAEKENKKSEL